MARAVLTMGPRVGVKKKEEGRKKVSDGEVKGCLYPFPRGCECRDHGPN